MNICFILDPWAELNPEVDSSLRIIHEAAARGHKVALFQPKNLTIRENETYAFANILTRMDKVPESIPAFYKKAKFRKQMVPLKGFDAVFLRKDPPLDNLMLNFLDSVKDDTFIINGVDGLRKANNKIYVTSFEEASDYIPETYVSKDMLIHEGLRLKRQCLCTVGSSIKNEMLYNHFHLWIWKPTISP